jgi:hypothetical protein
MPSVVNPLYGSRFLASKRFISHAGAEMPLLRSHQLKASAVYIPWILGCPGGGIISLNGTAASERGLVGSPVSICPESVGGSVIVLVAVIVLGDEIAISARRYS